MTDKTRIMKSVAGRIVFSYNEKVIDIIDVDEASLKPEKKVKIVEDKLSEMVKSKVIKRSEKFNVRIDTERFPPSTFLSSTHIPPVNSKQTP
ncbi:MAG: hypothetical protein M0T81_01155 [Thermoplasmatales archaeon]|nr:hypothetical protein [Thermoplasmatales archaeon]